MSAGSQLGANEFAIGRGDTTDNLGGGKTDVRAVQIGTNTGYLLAYFVFSEAGVGAGVASFRAGIAGDDAFHSPGMIDRRFEGMRLEHLFDVTHEGSFVTAGDFARTFLETVAHGHFVSSVRVFSTCPSSPWMQFRTHFRGEHFPARVRSLRPSPRPHPRWFHLFFDGPMPAEARNRQILISGGILAESA